MFQVGLLLKSIMGEPARVKAEVVKDVRGVQLSKEEKAQVETSAVVEEDIVKEAESSGTEDSGQGSGEFPNNSIPDQNSRYSKYV